MPENLIITAFIFGAILILLALVGGRFKVFGAEISGTVGKLARTIAFGLGAIIITFTLLEILRQTKPPPVSPPPVTEKQPSPGDKVSGSYEGRFQNLVNGSYGKLQLVVNKGPLGEVSGTISFIYLGAPVTVPIEGNTDDINISFNCAVPGTVINWNGKIQKNVIEGYFTILVGQTYGSWRVTKLLK